MMGCEHMGDGRTCGGCIAKIGLREKLIHTIVGAVKRDRRSPCEDCEAEADAILAKFDVTEKKPRYKVYRSQFRWGVYEYRCGWNPDVVIADFRDDEQRAREYCDFLNSKEPK